MSPSRMDAQIAAADVDPEMVRASLRDFVQQLAGAERERVSRRLSIWLTLFKIYGMF